MVTVHSDVVVDMWTAAAVTKADVAPSVATEECETMGADS